MQYTYVDGIRPGQNYVLCVQGCTSDDENAFGLQQTSERNCTMLLTGKNELFKALFIFFYRVSPSSTVAVIVLSILTITLLLSFRKGSLRPFALISCTVKGKHAL